MEAIPIFANIKTEVMTYLYELLDVESIINLAMTNTFFRKPNGLNKHSIIIYLYISKLMRLYTKECYCYLLSNFAFHRKINKKYPEYKEEEIIKGKVMAFIRILEQNNFEISYRCLNFGEKSAIEIFYQLIEVMPSKYKQMVCFKINHSHFFTIDFIEHLMKIRKIEIILDGNKAKKILEQFFDPVKNFFHLGQLHLQVADDMDSDSCTEIDNYFQIHRNCLNELIIDPRSTRLGLDSFAKLLEFNDKSIRILKIVLGEFNLEKSFLFFENLGNLVNLKNLAIIFSNFDENFEKHIISSISKLNNLVECLCSFKFQSSKDLIYQIELPSINLGEYYVQSTELYNEEFFSYFTQNNNFERFDFNFDNLDIYSEKCLRSLEDLSLSFPLKNKLKIVKIRSHRSSDQTFLKFIKNLKHLINLKEIVFDIMSVSVEFLKVLYEVVEENHSIIKISNETWASMSIIIEEDFIFYFDIFHESLLSTAEKICQRNEIDSKSKNYKEIKLIIKDIDLEIEEKIFDETVWKRYPTLTHNIHYISFDFSNIPDKICIEIEYFLKLLPNLKTLSFEKCEISKIGWGFISQAVNLMNKLNELKLICTNIDDGNCILLLSQINSNHFINIDFKGNDIGQDPLVYIFKNSSKFSRIIRLKYHNYGQIYSDEIFLLMEQFILSNKFIFTLEINQNSIQKNLKAVYKTLKQKYCNIFLAY